MKRFIIPTLAVGAILAGADRSQAVSIKSDPVRSILIDDFSINTSEIGFIDAPSATEQPTGLFTTTTTGSDTAIIGGNRRVRFTVTNNSSRTTAVAKASEGVFAVDTGNNVKTVTELIWGDPATNRLKTNFTQGNIDRFQLGIAALTGDATLTFRIMDRLGRKSILSQSGLTAGTSNFLFSDFVGSADFSNISSLRLAISGSRSLDYQLDFLRATAIPEPFTILGSVAAIGLGAAFRRNYKRKA